MRLLTIGTWDTPHMGHAAFLKQCDSLADEVLVGINTDEFVIKYKKVAPIFSYQERQELIEALGYETWPNNSAGRALIWTTKPNIIAIGSDWARKDYYKQIDVTQDWLDQMGIIMVYIPYTANISTTILKERLSKT